MKTLSIVLIAGGLLFGVSKLSDAPKPATRPTPSRPAPVCPGPDCPNNPTPSPRRPRPWGPRAGFGLNPLFSSISIGTISIGGPVSPDGAEELMADLPVSQRLRNIGSRVDGAGMCVMSSIEMMFRYHGLDQFRGLRDWCARQPGGGYPQKVDQQLQQFCQERHLQQPPFFQYEGKDPNILRQALVSGRMVSVTYAGHDGVRYSGSIAHMVDLVHFSANWVAILDNNGIGENELLWMTPAEFQSRWLQGNNGWAVVCTAFPPPSPPHNTNP